jgi:hypothetical protein
MSLKSLIATGTKVWSDSVDPAVIKTARQRGLSGATSNPIIIAGILKGGGFDQRISALIDKGLADADIAWEIDDELVKAAQEAFLPTWEQTRGRRHRRHFYRRGNRRAVMMDTSASSSIRSWRIPPATCRASSACANMSNWASGGLRATRTE